MNYSIIEGSIRQSTNNPIANEWEQMEEHVHRNLGFYGLDLMDKFLEVKELAEDLGLCPADTPERQDKLEAQYG